MNPADIAKLTPKARAALVAKLRAQIDAQDPCKHALALFGPTGTAFLESHERYRNLDAASRAGKTTILLFEVATLLRGIHPFKPYPDPLRILVVITRTDQAATVWGKRLFKKCELPSDVLSSLGLPKDLGKHPWIPEREVKKIHYRPSQKYGPYPAMVEMNNGSEYFMALAGDESSWLGLEGIEFDLVIRDEASGYENLSDELDTRLWGPRTKGARIGCGWLGGMGWGATATKDNEDYNRFRKRCQDGVQYHAYFHLARSENKAVSEEIRAQSSLVLSEEAFKARALGTGNVSDGLRIYAPFWSDTRNLMAQPYGVKPSDNLWITFDPGWRDPCGILCTAMSKDDPKRIRVVRWMSYRHGGYEQCVSDMAGWLDGRQPAYIVCDMAMRGARQDTGKAYIEVFVEFLEKFGIQPIKGLVYGRNRIEDGHPLVQSVLSNDGSDTEHNTISVDPDAHGADDFVTKLCSYRWAVDNRGNRLKAVHQKGTEPADTLKYLCSRFPEWEDLGEQHASGNPSIASAPSEEDAQRERTREILEREFGYSGGGGMALFSNDGPRIAL